MLSYNEKASEGRIPLTLYLRNLPVPSLKRLVRELGGVMSRPKPDLIRFCLVRANHVERANPVIQRAEELQGQREIEIQDAYRQRELEESTERGMVQSQVQEARNRETEAVSLELRHHIQPFANVGERSIVLRMMLAQVNRLILSFTQNNLESRQYPPVFTQSSIDIIVATSERGGVIQGSQITRIQRRPTVGLPAMHPWAHTHMNIRSNNLKCLMLRINEHITPVFTPEAIQAYCVNIENRYWNDWYHTIPGHAPLAPSRPYHPVQAMRPSKRRETVSIQKGETAVTEDDCCICLESKSYIQTNCGHVFCNCILHHFVKNGVSCPMCREAVNTLVYNQPILYEATLRILPLIHSETIHFI